MSYPPPAGYPAYPTDTSRPAHLRGHKPIWVGIILMVVGLAVVIVGAIVGVTKSFNKVDHFQRVKVSAGSGTVKFDKAGGYIAYYEADNVGSDISKIPLVGVALQSPSGKVIQVDTVYGNRSDHKIKKLTYDHDGHKGAALYQFHIDQAGTYQVQLRPNSLDGPNATIAFGKSIATGTVVGALVVLLGFLLLLAGVIVLIVGIVKHRRHKKQLANPPGGYGGGYAGYGAYGTEPAPQPQWQQQIPPQQAQQPWQAGPAPQSQPPQPGYPSQPAQPGTSWPPPGEPGPGGQPG